MIKPKRNEIKAPLLLRRTAASDRGTDGVSTYTPSWKVGDDVAYCHTDQKNVRQTLKITQREPRHLARRGVHFAKSESGGRGKAV